MANRRKPIPAVSLSCRLFIVFPSRFFFRLFPASCSWHVDRLEPNYNMLQKHTVSGNKKASRGRPFMLWRLPRGFLDAESCQIDISHSVDHQRQRIMRQIVQRIHGGTDGGDITTVLRHAAHHAPDGVAGIGIGDADMPIKIPDRTVKIGDRPLKTGFFAWPMPLPCYECRFPSRRTSKIHRVRIWKRTSLRIMKPCVPLSASPRRWPEFLQAGARPVTHTSQRTTASAATFVQI